MFSQNSFEFVWARWPLWQLLNSTISVENSHRQYVNDGHGWIEILV